MTIFLNTKNSTGNNGTFGDCIGENYIGIGVLTCQQKNIFSFLIRTDLIGKNKDEMTKKDQIIVGQKVAE